MPRYWIRGYWTGNIQFDKFNEESKQFEQPKYLFKQVSVPDEEDTEWDTNYWFNDFALNLNYLDDELAENLPPTDSRFWPDMRAFENGKFEYAENEKRWLEATQRERRKANGGEAPPKYFSKHVLNEKKQ